MSFLIVLVLASGAKRDGFGTTDAAPTEFCDREILLLSCGAGCQPAAGC
jgi:hypothetical protein